jgi:hypothetical protein
METGKFGNHNWMGGPIDENYLENDYETAYGKFGIYCNDCGQEAHVPFDMGAKKFIDLCQMNNIELSAETLGKDSCCCGATKSKPCACMKTGAKCSGSCACSTKEARAESLVWCEHDNYENYDARWVNNVRIDSYKCKTCGMENDKEQHLDQDLFNQAEREGYKLYDYGEWEQDEPYKYEKDGIIIEIPVVKEEDIYRLDSPKTPPKWAKPLGLIGGLAAGYISAQMIDNTKE